MSNYRPVWAEINLKNLDHNYKLVKKLVGRGVKILVPVKAHGYGHGLVPIAKRLEFLGVDYLGVASIDEGIVLRNAGIKKPILILGTVLPEDAMPVIDYRLIQTICTKEVARKLNNEASKRGIKAIVHIKVDTGMHRIGVDYFDAYDFVKYVCKLKNLEIEGIFTHLSSADDDYDFTKEQIEIFDKLIKRLESSGMRITLKHAANSLGVIDYPNSYFNMVRPGLMVYGLSPKDEMGLKLKPLLTLKTKIVHLHTVSAGDGVSYGRTYIAQCKKRIATLAVGYGDGYFRSLSNKASCLIGGKRARIVGRVCMDQTMVDVTGIKNVSIGDEAVLIGSQKNQIISVEELARLAQTIPYEIVCSLGTRIKWTYKY